MEIQDILVCLTVFFANIVEAITGFAGTMLAMPVAMSLLGIQEAKVILNVVAIFVSTVLACKNTGAIQKREVTKITGFMLLGMVGGLEILRLFPVLFLEKAYGILLLLVAIKGLVFQKSIPLPKWMGVIVLLGAGLLHGMFLSGGSLLVIYAVAVLKEKSVIRATLAPVWLILNSFILIYDLLQRNFTPRTLVLSALCLPAAALALWIGNWLHKKIPQSFFIRLTYSLLILSGLTLLI